VQLLSSIDLCTPTAVATAGGGSTPGTNPTSSSGPATSGGNGGNQAQSQPDNGKSFNQTTMIVGLALLGLLFLGGIGWFIFQRMLLPKTEVKLPPSGARPWSRTRNPISVDNPNIHVGAGRNTVQPNVNAFPAPGMFNNGQQPGPAFATQNGNGGFGINAPATGALNNGFGPNTQGFQPTTGGLNSPPSGGFAPQGMNGPFSYPQGFPTTSGNSFGGFASQQNEASMIPPGSGAFPVINNGGFAPASSAFNAMYGLPNDPLSNDPGWLDNLGNSGPPQQGNPGRGFSGPLQQQGNPNRGFSGPLQQGDPTRGFSGPLQQQSDPTRGFSGPLQQQGNPNRPFTGQLQQQQASAGFITTGEADLNDPQLAEIIRQYSQKSQTLRSPQPPQGPGVPNPNSRWIN
jgi:hypothetical protein